MRRDGKTIHEINLPPSYGVQCTAALRAVLTPRAVASRPGTRIRTSQYARWMLHDSEAMQSFPRRRVPRGETDKTHPPNRRAPAHPGSPRDIRGAQTKRDARKPLWKRCRVHKAGASAT